MADRIDVQITGTINLKRELDNFSQRTIYKIMKPALEAVGELFKDAVKANCNFGDFSNGGLRESIDYVANSQPAKSQGVVRIGPTYTKPHGKASSTSPGVYGRFVEFGLKTRKYPRQPFMRPAFDANADKSMEVFRDKVLEGINTRLKS